MSHCILNACRLPDNNLHRSFNEPDLGAQSNLTPDAAAAAFKSLILPLAGKAKICTPAITNGGAPMGEAWLDQFMQKCDTCKFDCVAFHIYDSATNVAYYQSYISGMASRYNLPLHITEVRSSLAFRWQMTSMDANVG